MCVPEPVQKLCEIEYSLPLLGAVALSSCSVQPGRCIEVPDLQYLYRGVNQTTDTCYIDGHTFLCVTDISATVHVYALVQATSGRLAYVRCCRF